MERDGSGDYTTIQPALDNAAPGDSILIGPGMYTESSIFPYDNGAGSGPTYAGIQVDDLTIVGAHPDSVVIGPLVPDIQGFDPKGIAVREGAVSSVSIAGVSVRNVGEGIRSRGNALVADVITTDCAIGILDAGGSLQAQGCTIDRSTFSGVFTVGSTGATLDGLVFTENSTSLTASASFLAVLDCVFAGGGPIQFDQGTTASMANCDVNLDGFAIAILEAAQVDLTRVRTTGSGGSVALAFAGNVTGSRNVFAANQPSVFSFSGGSSGSINLSDIVLSDGHTIELVAYSSLPTPVILDFTHNYWGTTDADSIATEIWDGSDEPSIEGFVEYQPFKAVSTPNRRESFGDFKRRF